MRYETRLLIGTSFCLLLASCGGGGMETLPAAKQTPAASVSDLPVKLGAPFTVGSTTYTPEDTSNYDEVGFASAYGQELQGNPTANGEIFFKVLTVIYNLRGFRALCPSYAKILS